MRLSSSNAVSLVLSFTIVVLTVVALTIVRSPLSLLALTRFVTAGTPSMIDGVVILDGNGVPYPEDVPCVGEVALFPHIMGATDGLLNGDHYEVYFKGMPIYKGKDPIFYRSLVVGLLYATLIYPKITFSVNRESQFMHKPQQQH